MNTKYQVGYFPQSYVTREENQDSVPLPKPRIVEFKTSPAGVGFRTAGGHPVRIDSVREE